MYDAVGIVLGICFGCRVWVYGVDIHARPQIPKPQRLKPKTP